MPLEIEIKLKVDAHDAIWKTLASLGAQHRGMVREINIFFDRPDRSLRAKDSGLRVRFSTSATDPTPQALLTFKGPAASSGLRSREAYDLQVAPHDQIIPLLHALGFSQLLLFEKDRDSWLLDDCHVELDTLPHFGAFLEIEGPSESAVRDVQQKLSLENLPPVTTSYSKMVSEHLITIASKTHELRFSLSA